MFRIFIVSFCFTCMCSENRVTGCEKVSLDKEKFEKLVERLPNIERFATEQAKLVQKQMHLITNQERRLLELQEELIELKVSSRSQALVIDNQEARIKDLASNCAMKSDIRGNKNIIRRNIPDMVVAFSATIKKTHVDNIGLHQNIVFSDVITNIGNAYNNHHGVFVAPVSGVYMFTTTLLSSYDSEISAAIEINGNDILRMNEKGADNRHGSSTQTVIVALRKGDDVSVQNVFTGGNSFWGDRYTSFSGVLLREVEMEVSQILGRK